MPRLKITSETGEKRLIHAETGENLLDVLTRNGIEIYAPCGGSGTCGKCRIWTRDHGTVFACQTAVTKDDEIVLPSALEASILEFQYTQSYEYGVGGS
mgnify:CR=1 FL=1